MGLYKVSGLGAFARGFGGFLKVSLPPRSFEKESFRVPGFGFPVKRRINLRRRYLTQLQSFLLHASWTHPVLV